MPRKVPKVPVLRPDFVDKRWQAAPDMLVLLNPVRGAGLGDPSLTHGRVVATERSVSGQPGSLAASTSIGLMSGGELNRSSALAINAAAIGPSRWA